MELYFIDTIQEVGGGTELSVGEALCQEATHAGLHGNSQSVVLHKVAGEVSGQVPDHDCDGCSQRFQLFVRTAVRKLWVTEQELQLICEADNEARSRAMKPRAKMSAQLSLHVFAC